MIRENAGQSTLCKRWPKSMQMFTTDRKKREESLPRKLCKRVFESLVWECIVPACLILSG